MGKSYQLAVRKALGVVVVVDSLYKRSLFDGAPWNPTIRFLYAEMA